MAVNEDQWLQEREQEIEMELRRLDERAHELQLRLESPSHPEHEKAKWAALWDLRQRALLVEERDEIEKTRQRFAQGASTSA